MPTSARHATRQRAASDILMQVLVRIGNLAIGVVVTALVVRTLGENGYGQWSTILVVLGLIGYFINFGMEEVAIREAARAPESEHEWIGAVILLRLFALVPVVLVSVAAILVLQRSHQMLIAGLVLVIGMPFGGIGALGLLFQLRVDNRVPMLVLTLRSVLWAAAVAVIYWRGGGMIALAIAMAATNSLAAVVQLLAVFRLDTPWPRPSRKQLAPLRFAHCLTGRVRKLRHDVGERNAAAVLRGLTAIRLGRAARAKEQIVARLVGVERLKRAEIRRLLDERRIAGMDE